MCWPLPEKKIRQFAAMVDELYIVEELDPFLETHIKAMGIQCHGKDCIPNQGELNTAIVRQAIDPGSGPELFAPVELPNRPPNMCAGCPHRGIFLQSVAHEGFCLRGYRLLHPWLSAAAVGHGFLCVHGSFGTDCPRHGQGARRGWS
jgi:hypothetical protein